MVISTASTLIAKAHLTQNVQNVGKLMGGTIQQWAVRSGSNMGIPSPRMNAP